MVQLPCSVLLTDTAFDRTSSRGSVGDRAGQSVVSARAYAHSTTVLALVINACMFVPAIRGTRRANLLHVNMSRSIWRTESPHRRLRPVISPIY